MKPITEELPLNPKIDSIDIEQALKCLNYAYDTIDVLVKALNNEPNLSEHHGYEIVAETIREQISGAIDFLEGRLR